MTIEKSEDRTHEAMQIDPSNLLEALGIDNYAIDRAESNVYLDRKGLKTVAERFGIKPGTNATGVIAAGWTWEQRDDILKEFID